MIWIDDSFPYKKYKREKPLFKTIYTVEGNAEDDYKITWQIDYSKELGMYRITKFKNEHWDSDLIFDEGKMSNEYKEWEEDRKEEAWDTINKIVEVIENWEEFKDGGAGYECFSQIRDIMKKGGWC